MATVTYTEQITFKTICCASCGIQFAITENFQSQLRKTKETFYCPNGHPQWYSKSEADKLKEQLEQEKTEAAKQIEIWQNKYFDEFE